MRGPQRVAGPLMRDLTKGPILGHLLSMALFIGVSQLFQTLYFIVDLYFVSRLGNAAVAGVSAAGNVFFVALAASQMISIGVLALVAQAIGRKDGAEANVYSDQALLMGLMAGALMLALGYSFGGAWVNALTADAASAAEARAFLYGYLPALALLFPTMALISSLRAAGVVQPTMILQTCTVLLNVALAPVLIVGWGTGTPLGAMGAGLASSIASAIGFAALLLMYPRVQAALKVQWRGLKPRWDAWKRIAFIGFPTSLEFLMMFVVFAVIYWVIRGFGAEAQAGFGIGGRIMQSIFLPAMAIAFAAAPIAGQNFGAGLHDRVRETFKAAALVGGAIMAALTVLCHIAPEIMGTPFSSDPAVLAVTGEYLMITSWNFVAAGLIMTCSSLFQGMGDTRPSLLASATRLLTFCAPAIWLSYQPWIELWHVWALSVGSTTLQCLLSVWLLLVTFGRKLKPKGA